MSRAIRIALSASVSLAALSLHTSASAQTVRLDRFTPAPGNEGLFQVEGPPEPGPPVVSAVAEHAFAPLVLRNAAGEAAQVVPSQTVIHAVADLRAAEFLRLFASFPFTVAASDPEGAASAFAHEEGDRVARAGLGDAVVGARVAFVNTAVVDAGASASITVPTATGSYWNGSGSFTFEGRLTGALHVGMVDLLLNLGARSRPEQEIYNVTVGPEMTAGLAARVTPVEWLELGVEALADTGLLEASVFQEASSRIEMLARARVSPWESWGFDVGGGFGLVDGYGTPAGRLLTSVTVPLPPYVGQRAAPPASPTPAPATPAVPPADHIASDRDGDHIPDKQDQCVDTPEDADGVLDEDGCPDTDRGRFSGVEPGRLRAAGLGSTSQRAEETTDPGRFADRHVEVCHEGAAP
ncbi:MAG: hypothetical protein HOW73_02185 [Polyangiaceae bacterium]|nr:hypothetical protein [Polyangiaceae bacterium]